MTRLFPSWSKKRPPIDSEKVRDNQQIASGGGKFPSGLKLLAEGGVEPIVDIVFIHGLTGDRERTWRVSESTSPWPQSLLPAEIPNARILTFGYDAYVTDWRKMVSLNRIGNHAMNLITTLATWREMDKTDERPIIFVCHSLGGIVCQDALTMSQQYPEPHLQNIARYTHGILFLGTPHNGSGLAQWAEMLAKSVNLIKRTNSQILEVLKDDSEVLARIQTSFHALIRCMNQIHGKRFEITSFYEELALPGIGSVVPLQSAIIPGYPSIGIHDNHRDMTKFENREDPGFSAVVGELRRWVRQIELLDEDSGNDKTSVNTGALLTDQAGIKQHQTKILSRASSNLHPNQRTSTQETLVDNADTLTLDDGIHFIPSRRQKFTPLEIDLSLMYVLQGPVPDGQHPTPCILYFGLIEGHPGFVRIGRTNDHRRILQRTNRRYGLSLSDVYTYRVDTTWWRLETLLHLELRNEEYKMAGRNKLHMSVFKVSLDKVRHVMNRWCSLIDPKTTPSLYDQHGHLSQFWYDRAQKITSTAASTPDYSLDSQIARWDNLPTSSCWTHRGMETCLRCVDL